jgi:outer membrane protein assembly factor BamB
MPMSAHHPNRPLVNAWLLLGAMLGSWVLGAGISSVAVGQPFAIERFDAPAPSPAAPERTTVAAPQAAEDEAEEKEQERIEQRFPGGAALKTDPEQQRLLKRADQCVEDGRLDLAAVLWQKVLDEAGDTLMVSNQQPPRSPSGTELLRYSSLSEEVARTLSKLPPQALRTYRIAADGEAQAVLAAGTAEGEEEALSTVVRRFFLSSYGDDAAYKLACLALDRHDFVGASRLLARILDHHPDPSMPRGDLLLRLAVASAMMGDKATAEAALSRLASAPGIRPPSEVVSLVRSEVQAASSLASAAGGSAAREWHMDLGNSTRTGHMPALPAEATSRTLSELWVQEYPLAVTGGPNPGGPYATVVMGGGIVMMGGFPSSGITQQNQPQAVSREDFVAKWREHGWRPTQQLLLDGGRVYVKTADSLIAYPLAAHDDRPAWKSLWRNQYELDGMSQMMGMMAINYGYNNLNLPRSKPSSAPEVLLFGDRVHQGMSIAGDVLYSLEGKAISETGTPRPAAAKPFQYNVTPRRTRSNWLTAYSAVGGKMRWTRAASDEDKEGSSDVGFLAAPVPCGNLLLVPVTDAGTIWLTALSAADGATVWKTYLCDEPQGGAAPWAPVAIAVDGREAYLSVGCGVIFAVDAVGGTVRWALRYQRDGKPNMMLRNVYGNQSGGLLDLAGWDDDVVIPYGRALVVLSSDCDKLLAIDRRTGELLWDSPRSPSQGPPGQYCLGVNGRGLFIGGKNVVRRYDIPSGRMIWEQSIDDSFGRGCLTADALYMPVKDSIVKFELEKGRELVQVGVALTTDDPVGNLFSDGEKLWAVGAGRVYAMTTLEHRLQLLAERIAAGDADAQLDRMRLRFKQDQLPAALDDLRGAYVSLTKQESADDAAMRLFDAVNELKLPQNEPLVALGLVAESFVTAPSPPKLGKEAATKLNDVVGSAINVVAQQKTPGGAAAVLALAPLLTEDYLTLSATLAIDATATAADVPALKAAIAGGGPAAQLLSVRSLARLAPQEAKEVLTPLLAPGDDRLRLAAARALVNAGDREVLQTFVALLDSKTPRIRMRSHQSLRALSGQKIDFASEASPAERAKAVAAWKQWVSTEGLTASLKLPLTEQNVQLGRTLYVSQSQSQLVELDADKKQRWQTRLPGPAYGCQGLPNGHRLVAVYAQSLVIEYDADGKECWRKDGLPGPPYSVQRLDDGSTLVACADIQQVIEIAPSGKTTPINVQGRPMSAQRLDNGNTLVALQQGNRVVEVDKAGKIVWEARTGNGPGHAVRLENGNTLVSLMNTRQVVEYDPTGKTIVWRSQARLMNPYAAQRLPSGNTLVADFQGLHELDAQGAKVVWEQRVPNCTGLSSF